MSSAQPDPRPRTGVVHHRSGIGDLGWHIPYIRAIAASSAGGQATLIARPTCRAPDLLAGEPSVSRVLEFEVGARQSAGRAGRHVGYAHLPVKYSQPGTELEIEFFGEKIGALVEKSPLFDPKGERIRS